MSLAEREGNGIDCLGITAGKGKVQVSETLAQTLVVPW